MAFARRRRLGPFRTAKWVEHRDKDLAALGRVGFSYQMAKSGWWTPAPMALVAGRESITRLFPW